MIYGLLCAANLKSCVSTFYPAVGGEGKAQLMTTHGRGDIVATGVRADNKWFTLEVDDGINPMSVVTTAGYNPEGWKYLGPNLLGKRTLRVKLVGLGYVRNLDEAQKRAGEMGYRLVEGQAREPFKTRFSKPDDKGPVVFGGSQWQDPDGGASVACLDGFGDGWHPYFYWASNGFHVYSRWLVAGKYLSST